MLSAVRAPCAIIGAVFAARSEPMESISVIVPLYNEKESLRQLHAGIVEELKRFDAEAEIIYVDDGSTDGSAEILEEIQSFDPRVRVIRFRRNFGKSAALSAGFHYSTGEVIVTLDADLQDEPSEMHKLIERLDTGADLVSGWKKERRDPLSKRIPSKVFNFVTSFFILRIPRYYSIEVLIKTNDSI